MAESMKTLLDRLDEKLGGAFGDAKSQKEALSQIIEHYSDAGSDLPLKAAYLTNPLTHEETAYPGTVLMNVDMDSAAAFYGIDVNDPTYEAAMAELAAIFGQGNQVDTTGTRNICMSSMAIGLNNKIGGSGCFVGGFHSKAAGESALAFGQFDESTGGSSVALGIGTVANGDGQLAFGVGNIVPTASSAAGSTWNSTDLLEVVGNGSITGLDEETREYQFTRSNARTLDYGGNEKLAGSLTLGMGTENETTITATQLKSLLALLNTNNG